MGLLVRSSTFVTERRHRQALMVQYDVGGRLLRFFKISIIHLSSLFIAKQRIFLNIARNTYNSVCLISTTPLAPVNLATFRVA